MKKIASLVYEDGVHETFQEAMETAVAAHPGQAADHIVAMLSQLAIQHGIVILILGNTEFTLELPNYEAVRVPCPDCEGGINKPGCHACDATGTVSPARAGKIRQMWADNQAAFEERCRQAVGLADDLEPELGVVD